MKAAEEGMPPVALPPVEPLGVAAVQPLHADGECWLLRRDEEVIVVPHEAIGSDEPLVPDTRLSKQRKEMEALASVGVKSLTAHTAVHEVVDGAGELNARRSRHKVNLRAGLRARMPTMTLDAVQLLARHFSGQTPRCDESVSHSGGVASLRDASDEGPSG